MADYLFLFRGGMQHEAGHSPAEMQASMQKWLGWIGGISKKGQLKGGQPLENGGKVIAGKQRVVTDGPYAEAKDIVGGYTLIEATDLAQAAKLSSGCPILAVGGLVEVRPIMRMDL